MLMNSVCTLMYINIDFQDGVYDFDVGVLKVHFSLSFAE